MKLKFLLLFLFLQTVVCAQTFVNPPEAPGNCTRNSYDPLVPGFREELINSAIRLSIPQPGNRVAYCSGTIINRNVEEQYLGQYFLTAWHCFKENGGNCTGGDYDFSKPIVINFNYQSPPNHLGQVLSQNNEGEIYAIKRNIRLVEKVSCAYGDFALCEILGPPIPPHYNVFYAGWLPNGPSPVSSFIVFGHPNGSIKQVAATNYIQDGITTNVQTKACKTVTKVIDFLVGWIWKRRWSTQVICQYVQIPFVDTRYVAFGYNYGTVYEGNSGSGLFGGTNRYIGVLSGGPTINCSVANTYYGKFPSFYFRQSIKNTLNPSNKWAVDEFGIDGRYRTCYDFIRYDYKNPSNRLNLLDFYHYLYPASVYQRVNEITMNSKSFVELGVNGDNFMIFMPGSNFTFNAGTYIDFGTNIDIYSGATATFNPNTGCDFSSNYRTVSEDFANEYAATLEFYDKMKSVEIPDNLDLLAYDSKNVNVELYPNPTSDFITVSFDKIVEYEVAYHVYNILGELVDQGTIMGGNNNTTINVADYPSGLYQIEILLEKKPVVKKFVVRE